jgi:hypothetical protein
LSKALSRPPSIYEKPYPSFGNTLDSVLILLPHKTKATGGGVISIVELATALASYGITAECAVSPAKDAEGQFATAFPEAFAQGLFWGYDWDTEDGKRLLVTRSTKYQFAVATIFVSVEWVRDLLEANPFIKPAYFVQDYEPW